METSSLNRGILHNFGWDFDDLYFLGAEFESLGTHTSLFINVEKLILKVLNNSQESQLQQSISLDRLQILDILLDCQFLPPLLLINDCPNLDRLKIVDKRDKLQLKVTGCPCLAYCSLTTSEPEFIGIDDLKALRYFSLDISNRHCFLELDRFDERIFQFANEAPKLRTLLIRTGNNQQAFDQYSHEKIRCQTIKWIDSDSRGLTFVKKPSKM